MAEPTAGRPTKYKPDYCEMLIDHMSRGFSYESFAGKISVCRGTLYIWEKEHEAFFNAKKIGVAKCLEWWETQAIDGVWTHPNGSALNTGVWCFNMRNRFNWRNNDKIEVDGKLTLEQLVLGSMKPEE